MVNTNNSAKALQPLAASRSKRRHLARGLSLFEAMISLAITSTLLVAVATAFNGASQAITLNDNFFRCTQAGRVTLNQVLGEIRNAARVDLSTANTITIYRSGATSAGSGPYTITTNESYRNFVYDTVNQRLTLQIFYNNSTASPLYELASNVTAFKIGPAIYGQDLNFTNSPVQIPLTMTVQTGTGSDSSSVVLSGAGAPRSATKY